jgi:hypothetical protein
MDKKAMEAPTTLDEPTSSAWDLFGHVIYSQCTCNKFIVIWSLAPYPSCRGHKIIFPFHVVNFSSTLLTPIVTTVHL